VIVRNVPLAWDRLQAFLFGEILHEHLADVLVREIAREEDAEARERALHELPVHRHVDAERAQRQLAFPERAEERVILGVPALPDREDVVDDHGAAGVS
jgi:hypothetical protein